MTSASRPVTAFRDPDEPLARLLAAVRQRTRRWVWVESLAWLALVIGALFWTTLLCDWLVEPPAWVRAAALAAGAAALGWILVTKLAGRLAAPLSDASLALLVERQESRCRDSLSTAVALAERERLGATSDTEAFPTDPELAARTRATANALAATIDPASFFRGRRLTALAVAGVAALASVAVLATTRADLTGLWYRRMALLADEPWPRRVTLDVEGFVAGRRLVARGSDAEIVVHARSAAGPPEVVELRVRGSDGWRSQRMGTRGGVGPAGQAFVSTLPRVGADTEIEIRGGDARLRDLRLVVAEPPALAEIAIEYDPPAYLGSGSRRAAAARVIRVPRGARVRLTCTSTKPLSAGRLIAQPTGAGDAGESLAGSRPATSDPSRRAASVPEVLAFLENPAAGTAPPRQLTAEIPALEADLAVALELTDASGLRNQEPIEFLLAAVPDERPQVSLTPRGAPAAITPAGRLLLVGTLSDDHGLAAAEVEMEATAPAANGAAVDAANATAPARPLPIALPADAPPLVEFQADQPYVVDLRACGFVPGTRLAMTAVARDGCTLDGGPNEGRGETWTLDVVTPDALRTLLEAREILLRRRFESAIDDLAQARARLVAAEQGGAGPEVDPAVACAEAAARTAGESADLAAAFRDIRLELDANDMLSPEVDERLVAQIAVPLAALAANDLPALDRSCRARPAAEAVSQADAVLVRLRAVLARMIELESYNQLVERLRDVIRLQEQIRAETLEEQKRRARAALGLP